MAYKAWLMFGVMCFIEVSSLFGPLPLGIVLHLLPVFCDLTTPFLHILRVTKSV